MSTLYEVTNGAGECRLIEAKTRAGARSYAAREEFQVLKATPHRVHLLAARGVKIETASEEKPE